MCVCLCIILFTCNILIMLSMFQRFMLGNNVRMKKGNVPEPLARSRTFLMPDSCDTSQKEIFLFHINFPPENYLTL